MRGQQNEPAYVTYVYEKLCEILNISQNELEKIVEENTKSLYNI
jgi:Tat protein secretion system quality control protein TatD with DNase activity